MILIISTNTEVASNRSQFFQENYILFCKISQIFSKMSIIIIFACHLLELFMNSRDHETFLINYIQISVIWNITSEKAERHQFEIPRHFYRIKKCFATHIMHEMYLWIESVWIKCLLQTHSRDSQSQFLTWQWQLGGTHSLPV